ncbi:DUF6252 family protein [Pedobacter aquatilis]|uniref:DUF6252 family protein n=1 Tax=Pedobacter aquatilis TaxID=351343 RepID=UPI00292E00C0|nr:DUF6252 family protein [Pedobacter aquatilis]
MQKIKFLVCALIIFSVTLSSCKKEIDYHPEWSKSSMSGKVDGVLLECSIATASFFPDGTKTTAQILGNKGEFGFNLLIDDFKGVGTYSISDRNIGTYLTNVTGTGTFMGFEKGTVKITSYTADKNITGTFEFEAENFSNSTKKTITEGKFSINLVPVKIPETIVSTANMSAKIDGTKTLFTAQAELISSVGNLMSITGVNGEKTIGIGMFEYKGVGVYEFSKGMGQGHYGQDKTPTGSFSDDVNGKITVTLATSTTIKGTFEFVAPNQDSRINTKRTVTEGEFEMKYSKL